MKLVILLSFSLLLQSVSSNLLEEFPLLPHSDPPSKEVHHSRPSNFYPSGAGSRFRSLKRQVDLNELQARIVSTSTSDPIRAAEMVSELPNTSDYSGLDSNSQFNIISPDQPDERQYDWNNSTFFNPNGQTEATPDGEGWLFLPEVEGLTLNRSLVIRENAIQPFYVTSGYDPTLIKRAVITWPGKPRDSWKYANLLGNALRVATNGNHSDIASQVNSEEVIVIGPAWLNNIDSEAGASRDNELIFHGSQWQSGGRARSPRLENNIYSYDVMDFFIDMLFDKNQFPALNQVTIAGHSMGGQAVERFALLGHSRPYDDNIRYWVGNPGSYAFLNSERPYLNESCSNFDEWPYGIGGDTSEISNYARAEIRANKQAVIDRFRSRKVYYALGLLDNGPGDTFCQAGTQGGNHLDRGSEFIKHLGRMEGGFPVSHTADFIAGVSHQDFPMISANISLQRIFAEEYNIRHGDGIVNTTSVGVAVNGAVDSCQPKLGIVLMSTLITVALMIS